MGCVKNKGRNQMSSFPRKVFIFLFLFLSIQTLPRANASLVDNFIVDWVKGEASEAITTLTIVEISEMRARDIKRRLVRGHGYGADEIAKMIDKKELVNALSYEEHRVMQKDAERRKQVTLRRSIIVALLCVIFVMFRPLFVHAYEVFIVNVEVYTDKKRYEFRRIREFRSIKALFGLLLVFIVDSLQLWLSISVLLSWVMKSKYFFPVPRIPIRPAELIASATGNTKGAGPLGNYGINVGPMVISWLFRFLNGRLEQFMGKALSKANKRQKKQKKAVKKAEEMKEAAVAKAERKAARKARRAEREALKKVAEDAAGQSDHSVQEGGHTDQTAKTRSDPISQMDELD